MSPHFTWTPNWLVVVTSTATADPPISSSLQLSASWSQNSSWSTVCLTIRMAPPHDRHLPWFWPHPNPLPSGQCLHHPNYTTLSCTSGPHSTLTYYHHSLVIYQYYPPYSGGQDFKRGGGCSVRRSDIPPPQQYYGFGINDGHLERLPNSNASPPSCKAEGWNTGPSRKGGVLISGHLPYLSPNALHVSAPTTLARPPPTPSPLSPTLLLHLFSR